MDISVDDSPVIAHSTRVDLSTNKHYINTLSIKSTTPSPSAPPATVLLHGYGAGLGFYFQNFPALAKWAGRRGADVYALDWLGMGRSARIPFTIKAKREDLQGRVTEAESFFVDSLEEWREKMGLESMTLVAHSLGGYFGAAYALKFPTRVHKLILLSPAGVPQGPNTTSNPAREAADSASQSSSSNEGSTESAAKAKVQELREEAAEKRQQSRSRRLLMYLWEEGWSPFQAIRNTVFWAPMLVGKYSLRRFTGLSEEETKDIHDYILNITLAKGSGEYCVSHLLAPGAYAHRPLVDRIDALKIPVTFVYGDHDWMDPEGGAIAVEKLRQAGNGQGRMYVVPNAGHHVYCKFHFSFALRCTDVDAIPVDNVKATDSLIIKELDRPVKRAT